MLVIQGTSQVTAWEWIVSWHGANWIMMLIVGTIGFVFGLVVYQVKRSVP